MDLIEIEFIDLRKFSSNHLFTFLVCNLGMCRFTFSWQKYPFFVLQCAWIYLVRSYLKGIASISWFERNRNETIETNRYLCRFVKTNSLNHSNHMNNDITLVVNTIQNNRTTLTATFNTFFFRTPWLTKQRPKYRLVFEL